MCKSFSIDGGSKVKNIIILMFLLPVNLFAGGVDVGNGTAIIVDFHSLSFTDEKDLLQHLEVAIENIKTNKYQELSNNIKDAECRKLNIKKIVPVEEYEVKDGKVIYKIKYKGIIKIELYNCDKPHLLTLEYKN